MPRQAVIALPLEHIRVCNSKQTKDLGLIWIMLLTKILNTFIDENLKVSLVEEGQPVRQRWQP